MKNEQLTLTVKDAASGKKMPADWLVLAVQVNREANRIPWAQLVLADGDFAKSEFPISEDKFFNPGTEIEISTKEADSGNVLLFKGLVVSHGMKMEASGAHLIVELRDTAFQMTRERKSAVNENKKDSDLIKNIIRKYSSLKVGKVAETTEIHKEIVQYYCSDWDFILSRADVNGHLILTENGEITSLKPDTSAKETAILNYNKKNIYSFHVSMDGRNEFSSIDGTGWKPGEQKMGTAQKAKTFSLNQGGNGTKSDPDKLGGESYSLVSGGGLTREEAKTWADAMMTKTQLSLFQGSCRVDGSEYYKLKAGETVKIEKMNKRFNGTALVTGIRHEISPKGWFMDIQMGLSAEWFHENDDIAAGPAAGLLPYVNGLQIGIVQGFKTDPEGHYRVRVQVPALDAKKDVIWARLGSPDAGQTRGWFFRPEKNDEVILGFLNDDPRQAVILGSLYNKKNKPPVEFTLSKKNNLKGIKTAKGLLLSFDDDKGEIELQTPGMISIKISDEDKKLDLRDASGNQIQMSSSGLSIQSTGSIDIKGAKVSLNGMEIAK